MGAHHTQKNMVVFDLEVFKLYCFGFHTVSTDGIWTDNILSALHSRDERPGSGCEAPSTLVTKLSWTKVTPEEGIPNPRELRKPLTFFLTVTMLPRVLFHGRLYGSNANYIPLNPPHSPQEGWPVAATGEGCKPQIRSFWLLRSQRVLSLPPYPSQPGSSHTRVCAHAPPHIRTQVS